MGDVIKIYLNNNKIDAINKNKNHKLKNNLKVDYSKINMNKVPYISTYFIKPVVKLNEEVIIDYYITDYYHTEYLNEDYSYRFTVTVKIDGKQDIVLRNMIAGDHSISLGSFKNEGEVKFSIVCTDMYGRNSHELFNFFLVRNDIVFNEYVMTTQDLITYNIKNNDNREIRNIVNLFSLKDKNSANVTTELTKVYNATTPPSNSYVCIIADTDGTGIPGYWWRENKVKYSSDYNSTNVLNEAVNTRIGLQKFLDDKKAEGYNKIKLLPGKYRIDHQERIYIPTELTLDLNGSTIKLNQFTGNGCLMIDINNTFDSHVINGIIEGDYFTHDYVNSPDNSEWVNAVQISGEAKYSSFENITIQDVTGYGSGNGLGNSRDNSLGYTHLYPIGIGNFILGDIDRVNGNKISATKRTVTNDFINIENHNQIGYLSISIYLGYQGNPCGTWNLICHFYDINKKFIKSVDAYQYRRIGVPPNAKFIKISILNEAYPDSLSVQLFRIPTHCSFKNVIHNNCRCVGMAQAAMNNMLVESCEFTRSGQSSATCAYDAEDGWDMMQDVTFKGLKFYNNPHNDFLTCAGHNFIIDGQVQGQIYIWERTRSLVVKNCTNEYISLQEGGPSKIVRHGVYRIYDNKFVNGNTANNLAKRLTCSGDFGGIVTRSTLSTIADNSVYTNCKINGIKLDFINYISKITMKNCEINPDKSYTGRYMISFNGGHINSCNFINCVFNGKSQLANHNYLYSGTFINCIFDDVTISPCVDSNIDDIIYFKNCKIGYSSNNLIYYSPFAYSVGTYSKIVFDKCIINNLDNNTNSLLYAYSKPNGYISFENCKLNIPNNLTIFDGYPSRIENITGYNINFTNSEIPSGVKYISDVFSVNKNIKINIR